MTHVHPLIMKTVPDLSTLMTGFPGINTLLFDMDGTLFDTERYHTLALQSIGHEQNIAAPFDPKELHELMVGKADHLLFDLIKDWPGFPEHWDVQTFVKEKNRHLFEILRQVDGQNYLAPLIEKLIIEARTKGLQVGLVTSSEKVITHELLRLASLQGSFDYILTRDDTLRVKPDPWPYITAMTQLGTSKEFTLIFEDSLVGLESARGSGAHIIHAQWY